MALTRLRTGGIAANAVVAASIAPGAVDIADGAITEAKLATNAVTEAKLATNAVTEAKLATNAVVAAKIANNAVIEAKLAANAVTSTQIASGAVEQYLNDNSVQLFFRNRIINGDMRIDQRNAGANVTGNSGVFTVDRFQIEATQSSKLTAQQNADSVTPPVGFRNYLGITSSSAYSVVSADLFSIRQIIEGFNTADLGFGTANASPLTLSFFVRSSLTGTFSGAVANGGSTRNYLFTYTISVADTWEYKTVEIDGDTTGTWGTDNGRGIQVRFTLGVGSNYTGTAGSWTSSEVYGVAGSQFVVGTNGATFFITGVQLEVGSVATPFERRPFGAELSLCQRYFFTIRGLDVSIASGGMQSTTSFVGLVKYPVEMRATPSLTASNSADHFRVFCNEANNSNPTTVGVNVFGGRNSGFVSATTPSALTSGIAGTLRTLNASSIVNFSAEL